MRPILFACVVMLCALVSAQEQQKTILVTGGAGFLGSHLCERLLKEGHRVICLDNFYTGTRENLSTFINDPHFHVIEQDVCTPCDIEVDQIYNLACPASPIHYQRDPIQTFATSVWGARNMLELARKYKARILQASTSEIYGDPLVHPQPESYWGHVNSIGLRSCYDEGKRGAETLFFDYNRQYGVSIKLARIFNTYGPRMHPQDGRVVSNFIVQAINANPITIYGTGRQTRSFCYVDDLIDGLIRLMGSDETITGPINLGNPGEFQVNELAHIVLELTHSLSSLLYHPLPSDDPKQRKPIIDLAQSVLGWTPKVQLHEGLEHTINYFNSLKRNGIVFN